MEIVSGSQVLAHSFETEWWASRDVLLGEILNVTDGLNSLLVIVFSHTFCKM